MTLFFDLTQLTCNMADFNAQRFDIPVHFLSLFVVISKQCILCLQNGPFVKQSKYTLGCMISCSLGVKNEDGLTQD